MSPAANTRWRSLLFLLLSMVACAAPMSRPSLSAVPPEQRATGLSEAYSRNGVLDITLLAAAGKVHVGPLELDGATYNGLYAGPVLRLRPGDLLRINLINHLSEPTNLHFHGIRTSPRGNSDNVHIAVPAGDSFTYEVRIPATQPPGLYWYHSHVHGISEQQVMGGLSGALVVEAAPDVHTPSRAERLFVLKDMIFDDDTGNPVIDDELHGTVQSINGSLDTRAAMRSDEVQLWRFTNQSADRPFHISLAGHSFRIVAEDGEPIVGERTAEVLDIMPASRVDVLVDGGPPGTYDLLSMGAMTGTGAARRSDRVLGHLTVAPSASASDDAASSLPAPSNPPPDLRAAPIDERRTVVFSQTNSLQAEKQRYYVNGRTFDAQRVDMRVPLGNTEEWTVRNDSDDLHVFHIHQLSFQVVEVNGVAAAFTGRVDTVRVPERGEVKLRMAFADRIILGRFMFHCHVLKHEDKGMMGQLEVYDPAYEQGPLSMQRAFNVAMELYLHVWWWLHGVPWSLCG